MIKTQCGGNFCCVKVCSGNFEASTLLEPVFHVAMNALPHEKKSEKHWISTPGNNELQSESDCSPYGRL